MPLCIYTHLTHVSHAKPTLLSFLPRTFNTQNHNISTKCLFVEKLALLLFSITDFSGSLSDDVSQTRTWLIYSLYLTDVYSINAVERVLLTGTPNESLLTGTNFYANVPQHVCVCVYCALTSSSMGKVWVHLLA